MRPITTEWVDKAEGDHKAAAVLLAAAEPVYDAICFHSQQCVEKYLKAWLTEQAVVFSRAHDLEALAKQCLATLPELSNQMRDLRLLTSYAVEVRYPGMSASRADADQCWRIADQTRYLIRGRMGL